MFWYGRVKDNRQKIPGLLDRFVYYVPWGKTGNASSFSPMFEALCFDRQGSVNPPRRHPQAHSPALTDCPTKNVGKTPPPHRVEKNGGQALNPHQKQTHTLQSEVNILGYTEQRLLLSSASALSPDWRWLASVC